MRKDAPFVDEVLDSFKAMEQSRVLVRVRVRVRVMSWEK